MDNRNLILNKALELFSRSGYEAVGVQHIAETCDVSKPTLYHYFGSKRGLLDSILAEFLSPLISSVEEDCSYAHDLESNLRVSCRRIFAAASEYPGVLRLLLSAGFSPPNSELHQASESWSRRIFHAYEGLFKSASADHANMKGRHALHAASFMGTVYFYVSLQLQNKAKVDDALVLRLVSSFMHGIFS